MYLHLLLLVTSVFKTHFELYVLLTVHPGVILVNNQFDAQFLKCMFISVLYMFRAAMCSSSGELFYECYIWFMSPCVNDRLVYRLTCIPDGHLRRVT
jgi:hypothetical protein